jgi:hypothetical protein
MQPNLMYMHLSNLHVHGVNIGLHKRVINLQSNLWIEHIPLDLSCCSCCPSYLQIVCDSLLGNFPFSGGWKGTFFEMCC